MTGDSFVVQEPFTANKYADVILRSGDGCEFHVLKGLLSLVSPIFRDTFSLPQAPPSAEQNASHDLPVVNITESAVVADALLRCIYPVDRPRLSVEAAFELLLAAQKYDISQGLDVAKFSIQVSCSPGFRSSDVLKVFALACKHRLEEETRTSAQQSLRLCLPISPLTHILDSAPARAVVNLFQYHSQVRLKVVKLFSNISEMTPNVARAFHCPGGGCVTHAEFHPGMKQTLNVPTWWRTIREDITSLTAVYTKGPLSDETFSQKTLTTGILSGCSKCKDRILLIGVDSLSYNVKQEMDRVASKVKFEIPWKEASATPEAAL